MTPRIAAVVVTFNRKALLLECLAGLLAQSRPVDRIFLIDNASTDGTREALDGAGYLNHPLIDYVPMATNTGGAGGFHHGLKVAFEAGYDWFWLMDDDGFPDAGALRELVGALKPGVACASAVVVCEDDPARFVFPFPVLDADGLPRLFGFPRKIASVEALAAIATDGTYPFAHFFNGALINLDATRKVGNVDREFFIFGDEIDYFFRLRQAGVVLSVLKAKHYHPDVSQRPTTPRRPNASSSATPPTMRKAPLRVSHVIVARLNAVHVIPTTEIV